MSNEHNDLPPSSDLGFLNSESQAEMRRWRQKVAKEGSNSPHQPASRPETLQSIDEKALTLPLDELIESIGLPPPRPRPVGKTNYSRGRGL